MRGGVFHIFFIVGVYFVPVKVWKRQGEERKEDVLHRAGASSLRFSLSGASARVLCLYWRLGSPRRGTLAEFETYRTGTVFSSHLPPRRLFASSTRAYFAARSSHPSVRPFIALHAFVRSAGHRRANPLLVPQTNLSEQVRSGRDGKGPRSFLQLIRSVRSRLNEGGGARLKFGLFVFLLKKEERKKKRKDAKPGCRDCSNPAAPTRFVYRRRASGYRSAASASCRSLSLCVRGRDFVSGEKLSVCDGGREVCVRAYLSGIQRSRKKKKKCCSSSFWTLFLWVKL